MVAVLADCLDVPYSSVQACSDAVVLHSVEIADFTALANSDSKH